MGGHPVRPRDLQAAQRRRTRHQQAQGPPGGGHPLRQTRLHVPRNHRPRLDQDLAPRPRPMIRGTGSNPHQPAGSPAVARQARPRRRNHDQPRRWCRLPVPGLAFRSDVRVHRREDPRSQQAVLAARRIQPLQGDGGAVGHRDAPSLAPPLLGYGTALRWSRSPDGGGPSRPRRRGSDDAPRVRGVGSGIRPEGGRAPPESSSRSSPQVRMIATTVADQAHQDPIAQRPAEDPRTTGLAEATQFPRRSLGTARLLGPAPLSS